jgi:hypothetical protein
MPSFKRGAKPGHLIGSILAILATWLAQFFHHHVEYVSKNIENITAAAKPRLLPAKLRFFTALLMNFAFNLPFVESEYGTPG